MGGATAAEEEATAAIPEHLRAPRKHPILRITVGPANRLMILAMRVDDAEMALNQIPLGARDCCAHWLIELRRCQRREYYLPWKCQLEKHCYEACKIQEYPLSLVVL